MTYPLRLSNGLRVLLLDTPDAAAAVVALHVGVGYRTEPPTTPGMAHLFEHLLTQDVPAPVFSRVIARVQSAGGTTGASTHQDHTEYIHRLPLDCLPEVLRWEAARLREAQFTKEHLERQLDGVLVEIENRLRRGVTGGFPWPALPGLLFDTWESAHDGFGDSGPLRGVTYDDCRAFFADHYGATNIVLTVAADLQAAGAAASPETLEQLFGCVPPGVQRRSVDLDEGPLTEDRYADMRSPGLRSAHVAAGYRLPAPGGDYADYAASMLLAALVPTAGSQPEDATSSACLSSAGCGYFGPADSQDPDALIVVGKAGGSATSGEFLARLDAALEGMAIGAVNEATWHRAHRRLVRGVNGLRQAALARASWAGRGELLFGDPSLLDAVWRRLGDVEPSRVATVAAALRSSHRAVLMAHPPAAGRPVAPPIMPRSERLPSTPSAGRLLRRRSGDRRQPELAVLADGLVDGMRVIAVDHPADQLSVRLSLRMPALPGWTRSSLVHRLKRSDLFDDVAGPVRYSYRGRELLLSAEVDPSETAVWIAAVQPLRARLSAWLPALRSPPGIPARVDPVDLAEALSGGLTDTGEWLPSRSSPAMDVSALLQPTLVLVGRRPRPQGLQTVSHEVAATPRVGPALWSGLRSVQRRGLQRCGLSLRSTGGGVPPTAAEHLAVALLAGVGGLPAGGLGRLARLAAGTAVTGRLPYDPQGGTFVVASAPSGRLSELLTELADCLSAHRDHLITDELEAAKDFCSGQWVTSFDGSDTLADLLVQQLGLGSTLSAVSTFPARLSAAAASDVRAAWARLFDPTVLTGTAVDDGTVDPTAHGWPGGAGSVA